MDTDQIMSAIFLIAVLALILPGFLSTNNKLKQFINNLSIWTIIILVIIVIIYLIKQ
jgi:predicted aspartyl protease